MTATYGYMATVKESVFVSQILGLFPYSVDGAHLKLSVFRVVHLLAVLSVLVVGLLVMTPIWGFGITASQVQWDLTSFKHTVVTVSCSGTMAIMPFIGGNLNGYLEGIGKSQEATAGFLKTTFAYRGWDSVAHYTAFFVWYIGNIEINEKIGYIYFTWGIFIENTILIAFVNQFVGMINIIRQALVEINKNLNKMTLDRLEAAVVAIERLSSASEQLNEAYGTQLLLVIGGSFLMATINSYMIVDDKSTERKLLHGLCCAVSAASSFRLVQACVALVNENEEFNIRLGNLLVEEKNYLLAESDRLRLHLSMKKKMEFTARGFFALDYGLINAMLGAVTTYLVILIQFGESSE